MIESCTPAPARGGGVRPNPKVGRKKKKKKKKKTSRINRKVGNRRIDSRQKNYARGCVAPNRKGKALPIKIVKEKAMSCEAAGN